MPTVQLDGLWHCLCPIFKSKVSTFPRVKRVVASSPRCPPPISRRCFSHCLQQGPQVQPQAGPLGPAVAYRCFRSIKQSRSPQPYIKPGLSTEEAYETLRVVSKKADYQKVKRLLKLLMNEHHEKPNSRLYEALILANADPKHGSPQAVDRLLLEMVEQDLIPDSAIYHAALKVNCAWNIVRKETDSWRSRLWQSIPTTYFGKKSWRNFNSDGFP